MDLNSSGFVSCDFFSPNTRRLPLLSLGPIAFETEEVRCRVADCSCLRLTDFSRLKSFGIGGV